MRKKRRKEYRDKEHKWNAFCSPKNKKKLAKLKELLKAKGIYCEDDYKGQGRVA